MSTLTSKSIAKVAAVTTGLAMATSMLSLAPLAHAAALTSSQVSAIVSLLQSFGADANTIANVQASLTGGTPSGGSSGGSMSGSCSFTMDLHMGSSGSQVTCLQQALIAAGHSIPAGATGYFGGQTKTAVIAWQKAVGISPAAGYFGAISRSHWTMSGGSSSGGTVSAGTGTGLKVMLSATSPNGTVLVQGQAIGDLGDYTFSNPTASPVNVTGLTFNRVGVSNDSTLTNIYLYKGGTRLTDSVGISASQFKFSDPTALFTVPAGGVMTVSVRSDIAGSTSGQQIGVSLVAVAGGTLDSSVSFPINSGYQTISAATLAGVNYTNAAATPSAAVTVSAQNDYPIWQDSVGISTNPVKLTSLKFTNLGSVNASDVTNLRLYVDGTQVGSAIPQMNADRTITFDMSASPLALSTSSHIIKVLASLLSSGAGRTVQLSVQRASDGMFVDSQLGQPVTPTSAGATFAAINTGIITLQSASAGVSVSLDPASPNQSVAVGATNVEWAAFDMLASGENIKVSDLYVYASSTTSGGALAGVGGLNNGKIVVNGVQVGSTKDIGSLAAGKTDFSLGSSLILPAGQSTVVDVYGDAQDTAGTNLPTGSTVIVSLAAGSSNAQGVSSLTSVNVPAAITSSNTITVTSSSLTANLYSGYGNQTVIAGANNAKIGAFTLSTGSTEGVSVNTIAITMSAANAASITNLTLKDDATGNILGSVITSPSTTNSFPVTYDVPVSSTKTVDIYANILSGSNAGPIIASVGTGTTGTGDSTNQTASVGTAQALQTITLGSGSLTVTQGAGDPVSNLVLAGASQVHVGQFNFAAQNSPYTVQNVAVLIPSSAATSVTNVTLQYTDVNNATQTVTQALALPSSTQGFATATFSGLTMYVPTNSSANLDVYVGTPTIASGATSGAAINVTLDDGNGSNLFRAIDSSGSALTKYNGNNTNVASNGTFYIHKSIPTFAMIPTGLTVPASGSPLYKFSITADPAGSIQWTHLVFNIATTSATVTNVYLTDDSSGNNLLDNTVSSASTTKTTITVDLTQNSTQTKYAQVAAGATKTYDLYGTVTGFTTGSTVTLSLASDASHTGETAAASVSGNTAWSGMSAVGHTISTTDWTNGYLLKNFTSNAISYSK